MGNQGVGSLVDIIHGHLVAAQIGAYQSSLGEYFSRTVSAAVAHCLYRPELHVERAPRIARYHGLCCYV